MNNDPTSAPLPPHVPFGPVQQPEIPKEYRVAVAEMMKVACVNVATNAWKIRAKIMDSQSGEPKEELKKDDIKKIARHLEAIFESFAQMQLEVKDRTNEPFDYGLPEKVVATQPQPGLLKERIIETIRPSIIWGKNIVQQGEVVIATPEVANPQKI